MNACVRAIVKAAPPDLSIVGVRNGGLGLLRNDRGEDSPDGADYVELGPADVAGILHRSGTFLKTARDSRFREFVQAHLAEGVDHHLADMTRDERHGRVIGQIAMGSLDANGIDGLVLIGGDTTCRAAQFIYAASGERMPIHVIPGTIDNDIAGTVQTIGFDSAVAMAVYQVDAIRETALAMDRLFIVEVMGREQGHLAVEVALATGAEAALIPEDDVTEEDMYRCAERLTAHIRRARGSALVIVAEGARIRPFGQSPEDVSMSAAHAFATYFDAQPEPPEVRVTILGHTLRGAPPTPFTRNLATRSGLLVLEELDRRLRKPDRSRVPTLVGMHHEGFVEDVKITGDMVRRDQTRLLAIVRNQIDVLAGEGRPRE
jgi:6-phosphofructokinase 1